MPKKIKSKQRVKANGRVAAGVRRQRLIAAALPLFAREGFRGVTTKKLAQEAGVSEALLYQHFPSKEALYSEVQDYCCVPPKSLKDTFEALEPSTASLVTLLFFFAKVVVGQFRWQQTEDIFPRLMLGSILEDGAFARLHIERIVNRFAALVCRSFAAARASGDLLADGMPDELRFWFCQHTMVAFRMFQLPSPPVVEYPGTPAEIVESAVLYMLRGAGLSMAAITQHYDYARLDATVMSWLTQETEKG